MRKIIFKLCGVIILTFTRMHPTRGEWQYCNGEIEIPNQYKGDSGNFLILDVMIDPLQSSLRNIFGPNTNVRKLYTQLQTQIESDRSLQYIVIGGNFNLVFD